MKNKILISLIQSCIEYINHFVESLHYEEIDAIINLLYKLDLDEPFVSGLLYSDLKKLLGFLNSVYEEDIDQNPETITGYIQKISSLITKVESIYF